MLYFKPAKLGSAGLNDRELKEDRKSCLVFGPCGVGHKALYLNSLFMERRFYIPVSNIQRAYKRVAMSKGGFTGKGIFGSIPYLVVEYDSGELDYTNCVYISTVTGLLMAAETYDATGLIYSMSSGTVSLSTPDEGMFIPPSLA